MSTQKKTLNFLQEFSIPLILGVLIALVWANSAPENYHHFVHNEIVGHISLHFFVNDIFMVFFFAMAAIEITQSLLPGGSLNPLKRAINPLMATLGGVLGPAVVFIGLNALIGSPEFARGWGIPTATDIALAWLVARVVFGAQHAAVSFLLLLAIVDDGIGLMIIACFYPDPANPVAPIWLLLTAAGMLVAYLLRRKNVQSYWPYIVLGGMLSWAGLYLAHIHPALALVFIVPFLPHPPREEFGLFEDDPQDHSTLKTFEHEWKIFVDFGLLLFGLTNAGVEFSEINTLTWLVFTALIGGKTIGIFLMGSWATVIGFPFPKGMGYKELFVAGVVAAMGLTVALFVSGVAFMEPGLQGAAKMGALFSAVAAVIAFAAGKVLRIKKVKDNQA
ncbi:Na+/H+ antiporter NhaA [Desulfitobacterium chlororespirans]|uniref:Na(+)/H(+) antiporter NhaA n=1 Tax=Desulfitobacterium chlororespirans DSM 11544 TaxID=1121395 RepID=A0A1M7U588_9FIRM|nr:Na+/H+ antiporter NhaA [Desulfitobacterium chlororespirans]SHN78047.1 sodium/proton antiporter, NhaA family [Desulfitobacterium chlororespirans DSM 11544]